VTDEMGDRKKMAEFNEVTLDDPSVKYFSYGASFKPGWTNAFRFGWGIIRDREGELLASTY
jgi:triacylglycerol lipase